MVNLKTMAKRLQYRRLLLVASLLVLSFTGLGYRLVDLQVVRHEELRLEAGKNTQREYLLEARRGDIRDAKGNPLATSVFVKTVCANPSLIGAYKEGVARVLAPLLEMPESEILQRISSRQMVTITNELGVVTNRPAQYVVLKKKVPVETWEDIRIAMKGFLAGQENGMTKAEKKTLRELRAGGIYADRRDDQQRIYPSQALAAHVLGYVGLSEPTGEMVGREGIEKTFDLKLRGTPGWRVTETDSKARELVTLREHDVQPEDGLNVYLTIDSVVQHIVEKTLLQAMEKHQPISASAIVIRPTTGEILGMATLPNFDPNRPGDFSGDARRNRIVTDLAEPGSTFKTVIVSGALNEGIVRLTDVFDCEHGHFVYGRRTLTDHDSYGALSVEGIITKSSNIGAAKIGIKMGADRVYRCIRSFGFGTRTGIPLPSEQAGIVHRPSEWHGVALAQIPMGHYVAVTRLQMTMAVCAMANKGMLMRPMLVDRLEDNDGHLIAKYSPQQVGQVISPAAAREMVKAMKTVVSTNGTAPKAALEHYTAAGKTGTAQKVENGTYVKKYFSSFIGFFPADNPELCISVTLDEPKKLGYYGGQTAAPIFRQIAEEAANYLNIRPDDGSDLLALQPQATNEARQVKAISVRTNNRPKP